MDITSDIAAVQSRISEITGVPPVQPVPAQDGNFAALVQQAMAGRSAAGSMALPGVPAAPNGDAASNQPLIVPPAQIDSLVNANAAAWQVDPALVKAIIANESGFNANATSRTGAQGLMQLEPETAAGLGVRDAYDPAQNISGGTRYIKGLLERFHGDTRLAVAAYNAGPGAVEKFGGVPPYAETQNYVGNVLESYRRYQTQNQ
jgi:soluble lytic murein transglycosylase-like protein